MTGEEKTTLHILLVEDDDENISLLLESLPKSMLSYHLDWDPCTDFDEAVSRVAKRRYDMIVTDIYRDRKNGAKGANPADDRAKDIVERIKSKRFCPIVAFTDGSFPESIVEGPFLKLADKSKGNDELIARLEELLKTEIPGIARRLHDELDLASGSYLWGFLEENWNSLQEVLVTGLDVERLVRRRAAMQLGRLATGSGKPAEVATITGVEYYVCPPVADEFRLGEIVKPKDSDEYYVICTPHCHLAIQSPGKDPRADYVLMVRTIKAEEIWQSHPPQGGTAERRLESLGRLTQSPSRHPKIQPQGRYWFLPGFLTMPDLYCDFLQINSFPYASICDEFERFAVLDTPFSEAFQSCFTAFYSAVGLPKLSVEKYRPDVEDSAGGR